MYVKDPLRDTAWGPFPSKDHALDFINARPEAILFLRTDRPSEVRTILPPPPPVGDEPN